MIAICVLRSPNNFCIFKFSLEKYTEKTTKIYTEITALTYRENNEKV